MPEQVHGEGEAEKAVLYGLRLAVVLSALILVIESVGAYYSHSLSVTIDAIHNIPDILAFAISWSALSAVEHGASDKFTFGSHRFEVFAGLLNAALVLGTGAVFGFEAVESLSHGSSFAGPVDAVWILIVAVPTLALRAVNLAWLGRIPARARDLNLKSVLLHLAGDLAITAALLAAAVLLLLRPGVSDVDPAAALVIAALLVYESLPLFRDAWEVLTESTPRHLSLDAIIATALRVPNVTQVHDLHVWAVCPTLVCMTAHVQVRDMSVREGMAVVDELRTVMETEFGILHATFEVEARPV
ncbi:MAG: cation diffusion facilitator family transporter [Thermoplasmata archaeon]|nr:cation diffusion facilitator family transporter [Thermoplasmata archaeon]